MTTVGHEFDGRGRFGRIHAKRFGSPDAPLVFGVHGLTLNLWTFDFLGENLGGDDRQLVAVDLRGRGRSETTPSGTYGWRNHALDLFDLADELGFEQFGIIGQSMGGSVAMKAAEIDSARLSAVVLMDIAGRVDPGIGSVIASLLDWVGRVYKSEDACIEAILSSGLIHPWSDYWERCYRYDMVRVEGGVRLGADPMAVSEDRSYGLEQDVYGRWRFLSMPVLLVRATQELADGSGFTVPADDLEAFLGQVARSSAVEINANHLTVSIDPESAGSIRAFLNELGR